MKKLCPFTLSTMLTLLVCFVLVSCVQGTGSRGVRGLASKSAGLTGGKIPGTGIGAVGDGTSTETGPAIMSQKVELSHLVDPFDGTYKKKLTLPKNFKGNLYLAGLNVSSLTNKIVSVRFNFGVEKQSVTLKATVARAPGIVPKTDIQVLVIDMNSVPFNKMRLTYDLYDYNNYTDLTKPIVDEIVSDPRDGGLYCRGLKLEDDPTFVPLTQDSTCSSSSDRCLYGYAKVVDATLYNSSNFTSIPTRPMIWSFVDGVRSPALSSMAQSGCLPDRDDVNAVNSLFDLGTTGTTNPLVSALSYDAAIYSFGGSTYKFRGPYRRINNDPLSDAWQIKGDAIYNTTSGLFQKKVPSNGTYIDYESMLFPRSGKLSLPQNVYYMGSPALTRFTDTSILTPTPTGVSYYVDGCNVRTLNIDPATYESISSCNVNASIEVFYMLEGREVNITTDKSIKLQLTRSSINFQGKEVLTTTFKRCENSTTCGSSECCFNSRCWSKDLVTQCVDQTPVIGNQEIGANCSSDFECSSLCCNQSTGSCSPHNPNGTNPITCGKSSGQQCVSKEFCKQEAVVTCKIVKSGFNADGTAACTLRCPAVMTYGNCTNGACVPPIQPGVPAFDPTDCSNAVDP